MWMMNHMPMFPIRESKSKTLKDYMDDLGSHPFISTPFRDREYFKEYFGEYDEYMQSLDIDAKEKYGNLILVNDDFGIILNIIRSTCIKNDYKWGKLWSTLGLKYDPVANVEEHTTVTTEYGEHVTDTDIGERTETTNIGERTETTSIGKRSSNSSEDGYTYPYENPDKQAHKAHNVFESGSEKATDSVTRESAEDNLHKSSATDKVTSHTHTDTVTTDRKGNIGVKSSQSLVLEERGVALFYFWDVVYQDVIEAITIPLYKED